ncbi:hypothetical protein CA13_64180 [Planctomycetes bacterium CA13]|uniref:Uncharacterized protein n=1 Tax=Novipirellula herctigrandis TaxID=2527986 RepID=A0A5C5ZCZ5_9BACT|nr:hypothetical protein CA13_64180 [Planctomycetes bacterium CA13]
MAEQSPEMLEAQHPFDQRLESANTLDEVRQLFLDVFEARDAVGGGYAIDYANSLCSAAASATRTHPEVVSELIDRLVLPFVELRNDSDDKSLRFSIDQDYLRKNISQWIYQYSYDEMCLVRASVLTVLEEKLRTKPQDCFFWCISRIGYRSSSIATLLWKMANGNGQHAAIAARTLIATGLDEAERDLILDRVQSKLGKLRFVELTELAIQELVGPKRMEIAMHFLDHVFRQKESKRRLGQGLAISVVTRAVDRCDDDAKTHDEVWSLLSKRGEEVSQSGEYGFRCNSAQVVNDYFVSFAAEMQQDNAERGHLNYIYLSRLQELVKPAHLRGARKFKNQEVSEWLEKIAGRDTGHHGQFTTTSSELKPLAMAALLELGFQPDQAFIANAVARESSGFVSQEVAKLLACSRISELPREILDLVSERPVVNVEVQSDDTAADSAEDNEHFCKQLGLIELTQSCRSRNAFEAMLEFRFTYEGRVLMVTIEALCELAIARIEEGDDDVAEVLLEIARHGGDRNHRETAISVFCRLCWSGYVHGIQLSVLVRLAQDEGIEAYIRSEVLQAIARTKFEVSETSKTQLWSLTDSTDETLRWRAFEVFIMKDWLDEKSERLLLDRLQLAFTDDQLNVAEPESLMGWQAYLLGVLYQRDVERFATAVSSVFLQARADVFYQLIRPVRRVGDTNPAKVITALASRIVSLNTSYSTDTGLFSVLAELSPDLLLDFIDSASWQDWRVEGRAALCEAAETVLRQVRPRDTLVWMLPFIKDSSFQVRRSAYRVLSRIDHEQLFTSCRLWAGSEDREWERRSAESTEWLPTTLFSDDVLRSMEFQGHREPAVRDAFDGVLLRRRQRQWTESYTEKLFSFCRSESFDVGEALRLARAIAKLGDDATLTQIKQFVESSSLSIGARNILKRAKKQLEKQWKQTTAKWPEPWSHEEGEIDLVDGLFVLEDGTKISGAMTLWRKHRYDQSEKYSWGGVAVDLSGKLGFHRESREVRLEIAGRPTSEILIGIVQSSSWKGTAVQFHGQSAYPDRPLATTRQSAIFDQVVKLFGEMELGLTSEQADRVANRIQPILEASDLAAMLKPNASHSERSLLHQEVGTILHAIGRELRDIPMCGIVLWQIASRLLAFESLELRLIPSEFDRFVALVTGEDENPPDELLLWLRQHAMPSDSAEISAQSLRND